MGLGACITRLQLLGMRLVKQTVNDDDQSARHLFFGDEDGRFIAAPITLAALTG